MTVNLTAKQVRERFQISDAALWNWIHDEKLGFPQPTTIRRRRYFNLDEIKAFEDRQKSRNSAAA